MYDQSAQKTPNEKVAEMQDSTLITGGLKGFANLVRIIGTSTKTNDKIDALTHYFSTAEDKDKVWVIAIFSGRRPRRMVNSTKLIEWCIEMVKLPGWLFGECYHTVGDLGETISLLLPETDEKKHHSSAPLHYYIEQFIHLEKQDEAIRKQFILDSWLQMDQGERFVFNKLIMGSFRIGVSQKTIVNALAKLTTLEPSVIAHRISGNWDPSTITFAELLNDRFQLGSSFNQWPVSKIFSIVLQQVVSKKRYRCIFQLFLCNVFPSNAGL
jgi:DNA ligase-1